ncbi:MAG: hypothetical protein Q7S99_01540 [Parvibaculum sp.]|nr:hypothetical protein [Parvibaculum sp.]
MNKRLTGYLIANGALVLLAGYLSGIPYATAVTAQMTSGAEGMIGDVRAWHMAHLEGVLNGMLMIAAAAAAAQIAMSGRLQNVIFWGLIVAGWTNVVASNVSAMTGGRGTGMTGMDWNTFNFLVFMAGIVGAFAAAVALAMAGWRAAKEG